MRRVHRPTVRRWNNAHLVGLVGPNDVKELQTKVHDYRAGIQASIDRAAGTPAALPLQGPFNIASWGDVVGRCVIFESESASSYNPMAYLYAGAAYDRGRELITELDKWRDALAQKGAPNVPEPLPVPNSDFGIAGGLGLALAGVIAILVLRELR